MKRIVSDEIAEALRRELQGGRYKAGSLLPSVDALRRRFAAGEYAVRSALHKLRDEGLVVVRKHVGVTPTGKASFAWRGNVVFVHTSTNSAYFPQRLAVQLSRRFEAAGWGMHSVFLEANHDGLIDVAPLVRHVASGLAFAVVMSEFRQIAELLDAAGVPYVVVDGYTRDFPSARAVIKNDTASCYAELIGFMKGRGMKTVLEVDMERRMDRAFKQQLSNAGITVRRELCRHDNETAFSLKVIREMGYRVIERFLSGAGGRLPDVILFDDDYLAVGGTLALLSAGVRIPRDVSVVTYANHGDEMLVGVPHSTIGSDPVALGDGVAKYVVALLDGRKASPPRNKWRFVPDGGGCMSLF
ncbi:MAG: substrate-binding domain-containing protein [Kiritimatiellae bacterium]|nr:substrate-binding domain-containing protein [Kiritimatiellia bacterium]